MISKAIRIPAEDIWLGTENNMALMILILGFSKPGYDVRSKEESADLP